MAAAFAPSAQGPEVEASLSQQLAEARQSEARWAKAGKSGRGCPANARARMAQTEWGGLVWFLAGALVFVGAAWMLVLGVFELFVGWLAGWAGWLGGWLAGLLAGWLACLLAWYCPELDELDLGPETWAFTGASSVGLIDI